MGSEPILCLQPTVLPDGETACLSQSGGCREPQSQKLVPTEPAVQLSAAGMPTGPTETRLVRRRGTQCLGSWALYQTN